MHKEKSNQMSNLKLLQELVSSNDFYNLAKTAGKIRENLEGYLKSLDENKPIELKTELPATPKTRTAIPTNAPHGVTADKRNVLSQNTRTRVFEPRNSGNATGAGFRQNTNFAGKKPFASNGQKPAFAGRPNANNMAKKPAVIESPVVVKDNKNFINNKKKTTEHHEDKKSMNKKALLNRGFIEDDSLIHEDGRMGSKKNRANKKAKEQTAVVVAPKIDHAVITTENLTVKMLAEKIGRPVTEIMGKFLILGIMVNINSNIDFDSAELIASEFGVTLEKKIEKTSEEKLIDMFNAETDNPADLVKRPPVVVVMGHVDHGKTSLLDYIRKANVIASEAGGITQHIGAYTISEKGEKITFIDTPGHAAFTAMRARGAKLTDVAILVVAADDGVMPQTVEAIRHIKEAKVPMIVAINKIDKPEANIDRIKQQLTEYDVIPEEWGGDAIMIPISAKTGENIDKLLEMIIFVADYQELKANPKRKASGSIIEARLDKGKGPVATVLVQNGTLRVGDTVVAGTTAGKVRAMVNDKGKNVKEAGPSTAVAILGLASVPVAGDELYAVDDKMAKQVLNERKGREKVEMIKSADVSVESMFDRMKENDLKSYNIIIKGDVMGSVEALRQSLETLRNEEVKASVIHAGVGAINENDVMLAQMSQAVIIGFNVRPDFKAKVLADKYKVDIQFSRIIYEVIDYVTKKIDSMKAPKYKEVLMGRAEIRMVFKASKFGQIAGTYVLDGKIARGAIAKIYRGKDIIYEGEIATLQREKNEAKEVAAGFECGVTFKNFSAFMVGDIFEAYVMERI